MFLVDNWQHAYISEGRGKFSPRCFVGRYKWPMLAFWGRWSQRLTLTMESRFCLTQLSPNLHIEKLRSSLNCVDELPFFLIPKVEHLSTHIIKPVQLHHLLNTFKRNWLSFQLILWYPNHQQIETSDVVIKSWQNYNPYNEFFHGQLIL